MASKNTTIGSRLTLNKLRELIQAEADRVELKLPITEIRRTKFRDQDYQNGACYYYVYTSSPNCTFMIFYPLQDIKRLLDEGYKVRFKMVGWHGNLLSDEIDFKKS